jgi:hypothetical protein
MRFMGDKVALGQAFLQVLQLLSVSIFSPNVP